MKKVYVVRLSQLTNSDMSESIRAFAQYTDKDTSFIQSVAINQGGLPLGAYSADKMELIYQGAIYQYKIGKIVEKEFISRMNAALSTNLNETNFRICWNAMCLLNQETLKFLGKLEELQKIQGFSIHIMGNTNKTHAEFIYGQFEELKISLETTHTFSYEEGILEPEAPKESDPKWAGYEIVDLRDHKDILAAITAQAPAPKLVLGG